MSQLPSETMQGYAAPSVRQFSVFLENRVGRLLDLLRHFDEASHVHVVGLNVIDSSDHAVIRMIPDNATEARKMLKELGIAFSEVDVLVVVIDDSHSLADLCLYLLGAELNISFIYSLIKQSAIGDSVIAVAVDDLTLAGQLLLKKGFNLLGEADLTV
ncbi:MAG: acetolactate synthase [Phycisphaerae bacterium]|nr:acetolactate synthase [Phycisphaerae bacterium]|tara:strand:+ start:76 stop:549 length:474 start_codon:yes stop_codon:yes gene_type:complete